MLGEGTEDLGNYQHTVGEGLVPSRGDNANIGPGNPGRHKTGPYDVVAGEGPGMMAVASRQLG
jgi:hypothetical protein